MFAICILIRKKWTLVVQVLDHDSCPAPLLFFVLVEKSGIRFKRRETRFSKWKSCNRMEGNGGSKRMEMMDRVERIKWTRIKKAWGFCSLSLARKKGGRGGGEREAGELFICLVAANCSPSFSTMARRLQRSWEVWRTKDYFISLQQFTNNCKWLWEQVHKDLQLQNVLLPWRPSKVVFNFFEKSAVVTSVKENK